MQRHSDPKIPMRTLPQVAAPYASVSVPPAPSGRRLNQLASIIPVSLRGAVGLGEAPAPEPESE